MRFVSLAIALFAFWFLLSGHTDAFLVGAGIISALAATALARRFGFADEEGHPAELILKGFLYWPWLAVEIMKSSLGVARIILSPSLPISPQLVSLRPSQRTAVGAVTYANSITLTPGTITVQVGRDHGGARRFVVHALTGAGASGLLDGDMDRRVTAFEKSE